MTETAMAFFLVVGFAAGYLAGRTRRRRTELGDPDLTVALDPGVDYRLPDPDGDTITVRIEADGDLAIVEEAAIAAIRELEKGNGRDG